MTVTYLSHEKHLDLAHISQDIFRKAMVTLSMCVQELPQDQHHFIKMGKDHKKLFAGKIGEYAIWPISKLTCLFEVFPKCIIFNNNIWKWYLQLAGSVDVAWNNH